MFAPKKLGHLNCKMGFEPRDKAWPEIFVCVNWRSASMRAAMALTVGPLRAGTGKCHPGSWQRPGRAHPSFAAITCKSRPSKTDPLVKVNQCRQCRGQRTKRRPAYKSPISASATAPA